MAVPGRQSEPSGAAAAEDAIRREVLGRKRLGRQLKPKPERKRKPRGRSTLDTTLDHDRPYSA